MDRLSPEQQFVYDSILQREEDDRYRLGYAEHKGIEKGKHETALAIARKMKEDNFELDKIVRFTALSIEEIESL